jgi:hypothetical protein
MAGREGVPARDVVLRAAERESTRGSQALSDRCFYICDISSDWVTHQHCLKIAPAQQPFTIT